MTWPEVLKTMAFWGPGAVIAGLMIWAVYKLCDKYLGEFVKAQQGQAESLAKLASGTDGLKDCVEEFCNRDNSDHREMTILLKCIMDKLESHVEEHTHGG